MNAKQDQALWAFHLARKQVIRVRGHLERGWPTGGLDFQAILRRAEARLAEAKDNLIRSGIDAYWPYQEVLDAYEAQHDREFEQRLSCIHYVRKTLQMPRNRCFRSNEDCCGHGGRDNSHEFCTRCPHYREITPSERHSTGWGGP